MTRFRRGRRTRRTAVALTAVMAIFGVNLLVAPASHADALRCRAQQKTVLSPVDLGTSSTFKIDICVFKSGTHQFSAVVDNFNWKTSGWHGSPPIFDAVVLQIQLKWDGQVLDKRNCNFTSILNRHRITFPGDPHRCVLGEWDNIYGDTSITADGRLTYNWNNDGRGNHYWRWTATSALHPTLTS